MSLVETRVKHTYNYYCENLTNCKWCKYCKLCDSCDNCEDCYGCVECTNCKHCILCNFMKHGGEYFIKNVKYTPEEYEVKAKSLIVYY